MATARESTNYTAAYTNKYLVNADIGGGRVVPLPFELTVVSVGATGDTYKLTVLPAYARVVGLHCTTDGIGASAGANITVQIGDSGDADRYMAATDFDAANAQGYLAVAGAGYTPTADTIVVATITGTPVVGKVVKGVLLIVPRA